MANAGLIISYLMLVSEIGIAAFLAVRFTSAVKQGIAEVRENLATNVVVTTSTQSATNSYDTDTNELAKPAAVGPDNQGTSPGLAGWKPDLSSVSVPTQPVGGTVRGTDFAVRTATFRNGDLKLTSANDVSVDIFRLGSTIDGMSYNVLPADEGSGIPRVRITWTEDGVVQTATFSKGFAMKLEFSQPQNRRISGKVYVCLPDQSKSWLAGTLDVRLPRQR